ncbi:hypothetical protein D6833_10455 [Candidatus Parcubacteria bacterium]|nr:MAG: hypothetical protein D6833_10455 [Candidatus Parcubacteria bacterium]
MANSNQQNEVLLHALHSALNSLKPVAGEPLRLMRMLLVLAPVSIHWMLTFHLTLFVYACLVGPEGKSPSLMFFVLLTYLATLVLWPLWNLVEKLCCSAFGLMFLLTVLFLIVYFANGHLLVGLANIARWIGEAMPPELRSAF